MGTTTHFFILAVVACTPASPNQDEPNKVFENAAQSRALYAYYSLIEQRETKLPPPEGDTGVRPVGHDLQDAQHHDYRWSKRGVIHDTGTVFDT